jgi:YidC/Oxa1 family membrane protein insertase
MDRRTVIAIGLCILILLLYPTVLRLVGMEEFVRKSPPPPISTGDTTARDTTIALTAPADTGRPGAVATGPGGQVEPQLTATPFVQEPGAIERVIAVETPLYRATFSNRGARLVAIELKHFASSHGVSARSGEKRPAKPDEPLPSGDRVVLAGGPAFAVDLGSGPALRSLENLVYAVAESTDAAGAVRSLSFVAHPAPDMVLRQTWRVDPQDYAMQLEVELRGVPTGWRLADYSLTTRSWPLVHEQNIPEEERSLRATSLVGTNLRREPASALRRTPKVFEGNAQWAAVQTRYFSGIVAARQGAKTVIARSDTRQLPPELRAFLPADQRPEQELVTSTLVSALPGDLDPVQRFLVYFGPNEYFRLAKLGNGMERIVDLGWSWIVPFSKALLQLMTWLYRMLPNYGLVIIVLATLVRLVLHPLNMMSMKSMRAMHRLQPEMERIREKYKNDPQAMNTAVMALYREHKVNPAGGCLPLLLQMPLFIALYSVLYNAIELRQAPFVSWIDDLSSPDTLFYVGPFPVRLLPLLMTASGFLTQKLTPTDPRQMTTMYLMNVVMLVFFYNLPSGLVLYWTVMNLLTALQQWLVLREDDVVTVPTRDAKAGAASGSDRTRSGKVVRKTASK